MLKAMLGDEQEEKLYCIIAGSAGFNTCIVTCKKQDTRN